MVSKKDNRKTLKFKLKIVSIFILSFLTVLVIAFIPRWMNPWKSEEESNEIITNTFYTVTPRDDVIGLEVLFRDFLEGEGIKAEVVSGIGVDLLVERLIEFGITLEFDTMIFFVHASITPTKNVTGFVMYYTDTLLYTGNEIFGIDAVNVDFEAVDNIGIKVTKV